MKHKERFKGLLSLPARAKSPQQALSSRIPKHSLKAFRTQLWQTWSLGRQPRFYPISRFVASCERARQGASLCDFRPFKLLSASARDMSTACCRGVR